MNSSTQRILVTGGAGAIGYHLSNYLSESPMNKVVIVDNFSRSRNDLLFRKLLNKRNVEFYDIDLCDLEQIKKLPKDFEYIYHLAAMNGTANFYDKPFSCLKNCTLPTINLLLHVSDNKVKRFIYAGSSEAYACTVQKFGWQVPTEETVPLCIDNPLNVRWSYGASKMHGEIATIAASKQFGIPFTIIRYHNVYGPRTGYKHVIPDFIRRAKRDIFELHGYSDTRSFIYVSDAVSATVDLAKCNNAVNQIVNLGSSNEIRMYDLGLLIMDLMGKKGEIKCYPSPEGSVKRRAPSLEKIKKLIDFDPQIDLTTGLKETIKYYTDSCSF